MSKFDEGKVKRIDVGDGEWVEVPEIISYETAERITKQNGAIETLEAVLTGWNLKDSEGKDVPLSLEALQTLDIKVITIINREIDKLFTIPKVQPPTSGEK